MPEFKTTIGLEIHAQLNTERKMFCGCSNQSYAEATDGKQRESKEPNTVVCPRCLGMPGTLPVANREAITKTIQFGLALGCDIPEESKFDRKHYFYPDLPKGYQISQYDQPFCKGGGVQIGERFIRLNRIHLEEDAGKLNHPAGADYSLVDLNRASTPLMEIVTEPDIESPKEAKEFMKLVQAELVNQGVSFADMEKGHMRCDANISVTVQSPKFEVKSQEVMSEIIEIKNINSFRFVEKALLFEEKRLRDIYPKWSKGKVTRGFNSTTGETYEQRRKEEAADYRYFPEPDVPPVSSKELIKEAKNELKKTVAQKVAKLMVKSELSFDEALISVTDKKLSKIVWSRIDEKWVGSLAKLLVHNPDLADAEIKLVTDYAKAISEGKISASLAKQKISAGEDFVESNSEIDTDSIRDYLIKFMQENEDAVSKYRAGNKNLLGFFVGALMREFKGGVEPKIINQIAAEELEK